MRNPAWRPAQHHAECLSSISHHFLGHPGPERDAPRGPMSRRIPILCAEDRTNGPPGLQATYLVEALTRQLDLQSPRGADGSCWQVYLTERPNAVDTTEGLLILVLVTASLRGIRLAYMRIKQLPRDPALRVGILLTGTADADMARRCHGRLALGVRHFLGVRLIDLGHISPSSSALSAALARLAQQIRGVSEASAGKSTSPAENN